MFAPLKKILILKSDPWCNGIGRWGFGRWLGPEGEALMNGISVLNKRPQRAP